MGTVIWKATIKQRDNIDYYNSQQFPAEPAS